MKLNIYLDGKELNANEYRIEGDELIVFDGEKKVTALLPSFIQDGDSLFLSSSVIPEDEPPITLESNP